MPRRALSPAHEAKKRELLDIDVPKFSGMTRGLTAASTDDRYNLNDLLRRDSYYSVIGPTSLEGLAQSKGIDPNDYVRYLYLKYGGGNWEREFPGRLTSPTKKEVEDTLAQYGLGKKIERQENLEGITVDSLPGGAPIKRAVIEKAKQLRLSATDVARAAVEKFNINKDNIPPVSSIRSLTEDDVIKALTPYEMDVRAPTPEVVEEGAASGAGAGPDLPNAASPIPTIARSVSALRRRPTDNKEGLASLLRTREAELANAEAEASGLMERASANTFPPDPELEESLRAAHQRKNMLEEAVRAAAGHLSDVRRVEEDQQRDEMTAEAIRAQEAADAAAQMAEPPLPAGAQTTMHNLPAFLGGRTGFAGKNIAAIQRELAQPYRPYRGDRVAGLDPLQRLSQDQARSVLAREKGMTSMYGDAARAIKGTMGERSSDVISPYLAKATNDPEDLARKFHLSYADQMNEVERETLRNLNENIIPSIMSRFSVRGTNRGRRGERVARDVAESLGRHKLALQERAWKDAHQLAHEYGGRNLSAAQIAGATHTADSGRIADTAKALHSLGAREQERALQGANVLGNIGAQSRAQRQEELAAAQAAWKEQQENFWKRHAAATAIAYATPVNTEALNMVSSAPTVGANNATQAGGLLAALGAAQYANLGRRHSTYKTGGSVRSKYNTGGRVHREGGGLMEAPGASSSPFQRGTEQAMESIRRHKQSLEDLSSNMDRPGPNPIWPWLMKTGLGVAASNNPNALQAIGQAGYNSMDVYENSYKREQERAERAARIHEAIVKTHQIEENNKIKNQIKLQNFSFDQSYKNQHLEELRRHNRAMELLKSGKQTGNYLSPISGSSVPIVASDSEPEKIPSTQQQVMLTPLTKEREKRISDLTKAHKANEEVKTISSNMLQSLNKLGWQGTLGDKLSPFWATLLAGNEAEHGKFEKDSAALQLARKDATQGRTTNPALKLIEESKPRHGVNKGTNRLVLNETVGESLRKDMLIPFEIKCLESNIPDSVIEEAVSKWKKDNPVVIKGKPAIPKNKPEDYLPPEYKAQIGLGRPTSAKSTSSSVVNADIAAIDAELAKRGVK